MKYFEEIILKNGKKLLLRGGVPQDAEAVLWLFNKTHSETDNLLTYPEENSFTVKDEEEFLTKMNDSENEIEILAIVDDKIVGSAGITSVSDKIKLKHRAEFGISILKDYWGMGIGKELTNACISCAVNAGYEQLELDVIADNAQAVKLYEKCGFKEYGRNPKGFKTKEGKYQTLVLMCRDLKDAAHEIC